MNIDELKALAMEEMPDGYSSGMEIFLYVQNILGIDYSAIYEMALASQPEITPEPWPDQPDDDW